MIMMQNDERMLKEIMHKNIITGNTSKNLNLIIYKDKKANNLIMRNNLNPPLSVLVWRKKIFVLFMVESHLVEWISGKLNT